jgi:uncharacterized protein (DUF1501 family)
MSRPARSCCESVREWDPRMPLPAGTGMDRRRFLLSAAGGLLSVYGAGRLGLGPTALREGIAEAAAGPSAPVLVSVFLAGGVDSLSVLAPVGDPGYRRNRPTLAIADGSGTAFTEDSRLRWAPSAAALARLHDAGKLTVLPAIGYTSPDLSHFTSRHYWEVGVTDAHITAGWLGRYLDHAGDAANPLQGLSMDGGMNPTLATARAPVAAIDTPEGFSLWLEDVWGDVFDLTLDATAALGRAQLGSRDPALAQVAAAASEVGTVRTALAPFRNANGGPAYRSTVQYPSASNSDLPQRLAGLAAMIARGLPLRCVALTADTPFDTHSAQAGTLGPGVSLVSDALAAFQADLEARGVADRVLVHVWSEFGRRVQENGSQGTDHGAGGMSMLIGTRVKGSMIGEWPGLARLDPNGNLTANTDFRALYCSLLEQWFGTDAAAVIPRAGAFGRYALLR